VREIIIPEDFKCVLPHHHAHNPCILHRFRLFVVGKVRPAALRQALTGIDLGSPAQRKSGKSSLIKAVFKVDVTVRFHTSVILRRRHDRTMKTRPACGNTHAESGINAEFRPEDNRYLIVHEFAGFESQAGDSQNLRTIRDFISYRTDPSCPRSERLHAVW
jgi:hypothetical protein